MMAWDISGLGAGALGLRAAVRVDMVIDVRDVGEGVDENAVHKKGTEFSIKVT